MDLNTFVAQTIKQIAQGVSQAQTDIDEYKAVINPRGQHNVNGLTVVSNVDHEVTQIIDFDISLTETESTQAGANIGVFFGSVGLGVHGKSELGSNAMNRVKFSVPIALPSFFIGRK